MKYITLIGLLTTTLLIASCTSIRVRSDFAPEVDFTMFKTFHVLENPIGFPADFNPLNKSRIEKALVNKMKEFGYAESNESDLRVTFFVSKKNVKGKSIIEYYENYNYEEKFETNDYIEGTLVVDIMDVKKKQIIWHGILNRATDENLKRAEDRINKNIEKMFKLFEEQLLLKNNWKKIPN